MPYHWKALARLTVEGSKHVVHFEYGLGGVGDDVCEGCRRPLPCDICGRRRTLRLGGQDFAIRRLVLEEITFIDSPCSEGAVKEALLRHRKFTTTFCTDCFQDLPSKRFWGESAGVTIAPR